MNSNNYGVVFVTFPSLKEGKEISQSLLDSKLAACINLFPVNSLYIWQGEVNDEQEYQLIIKTDLSKFNELTAQIKTLHSYEVPEIVALPICNGSASYLNWLGESLR
ncbi:divalent-cation tolerance protein CutA [Pleurocapsa sp. PCC 7319]|uniref:divalent-cation tolerance protein CutA n=1 Tax=Pleurocapsa sp. PCC 7319 TaxID=118161 RepID=UPI0003487EE5|nr:divalent-cation tolerance protein CutA [Pleurocapsa sp. PCC 7319]